MANPAPARAVPHAGGRLRLAGLTVLMLLAARPLSAQLQILDSRLPTGVAGAPYAYFALTAAGGTPPYSFTLTAGTLPAGVTFDASGLFQGTPATVESRSLTFQVTDGASASATKSLTLTVAPPPAPPQ